MDDKKYMISDAAKQVEVESHVLRYWEEELELPIKRNKLGHRYYTTDDVNRLKRVKSMKEQGFQLKAIKNALKRELTEEKQEEQEKPVTMAITLSEKAPVVSMVSENANGKMQERFADEKEEKVYRLQLLLKNMMVEAVKEGNELLGEQIRENILKELDYQFRMQEEREENRENERILREEEHFKKIDEMLRERAGRTEERSDKREKRKKHSFF